MMFGRNTRAMLPSAKTKRIRSNRQVTPRRANGRLPIKHTYDKGARDLKPLVPGQPVCYHHSEGKKCDRRRGAVRSEHSDRSFIIDGKKGVYRRNRVHLFSTTHLRSLKRTPLPVMENVQSPLTQAKKTTESQNTTQADAAQTDMQTRPQWIRKEPYLLRL